MTIGDDELAERLLGYIVEVPRKSARAIMSVLQDVGHERSNLRLHGFGVGGPDELPDRCIDLLKAMAADDRIKAAGDVDKPRFSEIGLTFG